MNRAHRHRRGVVGGGRASGGRNGGPIALAASRRRGSWRCSESITTAVPTAGATPADVARERAHRRRRARARRRRDRRRAWSTPPRAGVDGTPVTRPTPDADLAIETARPDQALPLPDRRRRRRPRGAARRRVRLPRPERLGQDHDDPDAARPRRARRAGDARVLGSPTCPRHVDAVLPRVGALVEGPAFSPFLSGEREPPPLRRRRPARAARTRAARVADGARPGRTLARRRARRCTPTRSA